MRQILFIQTSTLQKYLFTSTACGWQMRKMKEWRKNLTEGFLFHIFSMNLQNDFDLGQMTSLHRKLHCLTGDVCISCAQLLATCCYCRPPHSQSKLTFETNISSCFHNQQNDICSGCEPQCTHPHRTHTHKHHAGSLSLPLKTFVIHFSQCFCLFISAPCEAFQTEDSYLRPSWFRVQRGRLASNYLQWFVRPSAAWSLSKE